MEELESICLCVMPAARSGVPPPWKKLQIPPTMSSSHSVQPKNSSIPRSPIVFPQPLWGGQLYLESPNNDDYNRAFLLLLNIDGTAGIRVCLKVKYVMLKLWQVFIQSFSTWQRREGSPPASSDLMICRKMTAAAVKLLYFMMLFGATAHWSIVI